jgi:hypothetical protein
MRQHHRRCYAGTPIVHYTWFALERTFCGLRRLHTVPFTTAYVTCVVCVTTSLMFPPGTDLNQELTIAQRRNGFDF